MKEKKTSEGELIMEEKKESRHGKIRATNIRPSLNISRELYENIKELAAKNNMNFNQYVTKLFEDQLNK